MTNIHLKRLSSGFRGLLPFLGMVTLTAFAPWLVYTYPWFGIPLLILILLYAVGMIRLA